MASLESEMFAQLSVLREEYRAHLQTEISELTDLVYQLDSPTQNEQPVNDLYQRLHKLAGSGGSFGFNRLSIIARDLQNKLKPFLNDTTGQSLSEETLNSLRNGIIILASTIDEQSPQIITPLLQPKVQTKALVSVWVIEDDKLLGEELRNLLQQFSFNVKLFTRFDAAELAAQTEQPDILIMDVLFTEEELNSTVAFNKSSRLKALSCPKIFISGVDDFSSRIRAARLGADAFLLKPLNIPRLIDQLEYILDREQAEPYRILIVDDDIKLAEHFRLVLNMAGMTVSVLNDSDKLIETIHSFRPEIILLDLLMPVFSGPELAAVIRQYPEWVSLSIVFLSAENDLDTQINALGRGADDFIVKPISDAQLVAAVRTRAIRSRQIDELVAKDSLTGLLKHSRIKEETQLEIARSKRNNTPLSLAMVDIDHFKRINDCYGHLAGDEVIKVTANLLRQYRRQSDSVGRYGGEEFAMLLPECNSESAFKILEDIRQSFSSINFFFDNQYVKCSLSAGIASYPAGFIGSGEGLFAAADQALYQAKQGGRNQVRTWTPEQLVNE